MPKDSNKKPYLIARLKKGMKELYPSASLAIIVLKPSKETLKWPRLRLVIDSNPTKLVLLSIDDIEKAYHWTPKMEEE